MEAPEKRSPRHVPRPRLTRLLDLAEGQVIVITAPAGYGKTLLAREWVEGKAHAPWYRATAAAADVATFSHALAEAAASVVPGAADRIRRRPRVEATPEQAARPLAELLAEDLAHWPADAWLVVDDYHLVAGSAPVEEFIDWLLTLAPIRLLVTTRRRPSWASARRVLYGEITEVGVDELAMTPEEAALVVEGQPPESVAALLEQAQGWPAVIGLAGLSSTAAAPRARLADALFRYFAEEVFRREPPMVQRFMLAASVPARVDAASGAEVLDLAQSEVVVERLRADGLLHEAGELLCFHPLLREFLQRKLMETDPDLRGRLYAHAIAAAHEAGRAEEAFELAVEGSRLDAAANVMCEVVGELLDRGRIETIERWLAACGPGALVRPALALAKAEVLIRRGQVFEASALAHDFARRLAPDDTYASAAWYLAGRTFQLLSQDARALECHLKARDCARNRHDATNALWGAITVAAQLESHELESLVAELETVAADDLDARLQLASAWVSLASRRGSLRGVREKVEALVPLADSGGDPMATNGLLLAAAYLNISAGRYRRAHELVSRAQASAERFRLGRMKTASCLCYRAAASVGLRRFGDAEAALAELEALGVDQTTVIVWERRNLRTKLLLSRSQPDRVLADVVEPPPGAPPASVGEHAGLVALAAAAAGQSERALAEADRAEALSSSVESRTYARLARVLATESGDSADVVVETITAGMADAVVLAYRAWPPLLALALRAEGARPLVLDLIEQASDQVLARRVGLVSRSARVSDTGPLTHREQEVLDLIALGLSNAEISRRLFISEKTTKVHIHHIFEKLGVTSRVQALLATNKLVSTDG